MISYVYLGCGEDNRAGSDSTVTEFSHFEEKGHHAVQGHVAPELVRGGRVGQGSLWARTCFIF